MRGSPLYRDTLALCGVLLQELDDGSDYIPLRRRVTDGALCLLDQMTLALALAGSDRYDRVLQADAELQTLRTHLHLAFEIGITDEETFLALAEQMDTIGRQIGGWLKKLRREATAQA